MRTTFTLAPDVAAKRTRYRHQTEDIGLKVDVTDVGAVLELLDDDAASLHNKPARGGSRTS